MLTIDHDIDLGPLTTFGCSAKAEYATVASSIEDVAEAVTFAQNKGLVIRILGGGSNVLLTGNVEGLVIVNKIRQRAECIDGPMVHVRFGSGENWHDAVTWTVEQGWSGLENLALIPGTVGAAPMQNIGAYGVEQASIFEELEAFDIASGEIRKFTASDCAFGYRVSVFKRELWVIKRGSLHQPFAHTGRADVCVKVVDVINRGLLADHFATSTCALFLR